MTALVELRAVRKRHRPRPGESIARELFQAIDLAIEPGEFVAIEGPSGSGKSTLLHLVGALDPNYEGAITLGGRDLASLPDMERAALRHRMVGFVFQAFHLLPHLTALENVLLPAAFGEVPDASIRAREALAQVGLSELHDALPPTLSGGERQRVALARALLARPPLLLADEPTGNLDAHTGAGIIELFRALNAQGTALLVVTHELRVSRAARRVLVLREGRLDPVAVDPLQTPGEGAR